MRIAAIISLSAAALAVIGSASIATVSTALAQQERSGIVTEINRLNGTIAIRQAQNGTVGANATDAAEPFKVQGGLSLDAVHAGDKVSFTATDTGATKTITRIQKQ
jgi:Cu/Ag efflux protein CusF